MIYTFASILGLLLAGTRLQCGLKFEQQHASLTLTEYQLVNVTNFVHRCGGPDI